MNEIDIIDINKQIIEIDNKLSELKNQKNKLLEQKYKLEDILWKKYTTYTTFDFFPEEFQKLAIYKPNEYRLYNGNSESCNSYYLEYDKYRFNISDRPDDNYPYSFRISIKSDDGEWIELSCTESQDRSDVPFIVKLFYRYPVKITSADSLHYGFLLDLDSIINRAKNLFGDVWNDELSFGVIVFYYWVKIYYQNNEIDLLHNIFEIDSNNNR
ncbi:putative ORFan [Tupanvirus deep ocean]|uniref:ORFan n=2 Tax=Tupanvirus TaxID=2094720 RepID=A0AC62A789_9VIRU|nr:putative ORFan [Tupanvirus deep ocean]QKU33553.1 putative ORFan [Tupanvirus deep ocean]